MTSIYLHKNDKGWHVVVDDQIADGLCPEEALGVVAATIFAPEWHARFASHKQHPFLKSLDDWREHARVQAERHSSIASQQAVEEVAQFPERFERDGETWVAHYGGDCPVPPQTKVRYLIRKGRQPAERLARDLRWSDQNAPDDIICYQIIEET